MLNLFPSLLFQGSDGPVGPRGQPGEPVSNHICSDITLPRNAMEKELTGCFLHSMCQVLLENIISKKSVCNIMQYLIFLHIEKVEDVFIKSVLWVLKNTLFLVQNSTESNDSQTLREL